MVEIEPTDEAALVTRLRDKALKNYFGGTQLLHPSSRLYYHFRRALRVLANEHWEGVGQHRKNGSYAFVPCDDTGVITRIAGAKHLFFDHLERTRMPHLIDVGCGIGNVMLLAYLMRCHVSGIDINPECVKIAKALNVNHGKKTKPSRSWSVLCQDILKYDGYHKHDIIYMYCPFSNDGKQEMLEKKIAQDAKFNAIIIAISCGKIFEDDDRFVRHAGVYLKERP